MAQSCQLPHSQNSTVQGVPSSITFSRRSIDNCTDIILQLQNLQHIQRCNDMYNMIRHKKHVHRCSTTKSTTEPRRVPVQQMSRAKYEKQGSHELLPVVAALLPVVRTHHGVGREGYCTPKYGGKSLLIRMGHTRVALVRGPEHLLHDCRSALGECHWQGEEFCSRAEVIVFSSLCEAFASRFS